MKITTSTDRIQERPELINAMKRLLNTSLEDINSYDELTDIEKRVISRDEFNMLFL